MEETIYYPIILRKIFRRQGPFLHFEVLVYGWYIVVYV